MLLLALEHRPEGHACPQTSRLLECDFDGWTDGGTARFRGPVRYTAFEVSVALPSGRPRRMRATVVSEDGDTFVALLTDLG